MRVKVSSPGCAGCVGGLVLAGVALVGTGIYMYGSWGRTAVLLIVAGTLIAGVVVLPLAMCALGVVVLKAVLHIVRRASKGAKISVPPLPSLTGTGLRWTGTVTLPSWAGYQCRSGVESGNDQSFASFVRPRPSRKSNEPLDGTSNLSVVPPKSPWFVVSPPCAEQGAAFEYLVANDAEVAEAVLEAMLREWPNWWRQCHPEANDSRAAPPITRDELRKGIQLSAVHVTNVVKEGTAYVGLDFDCDLDPASGVLVLLHRGRVVRTAMGLGSSPVRMAVEDGGEYLRRRRR